MIIIGCDFHTRYQQIAMANDETGELLLERRPDHESGEAQAFYRSLQGGGWPKIKRSAAVGLRGCPMFRQKRGHPNSSHLIRLVPPAVRNF